MSINIAPLSLKHFSFFSDILQHRIKMANLQLPLNQDHEGRYFISLYQPISKAIILIFQAQHELFLPSEYMIMKINGLPLSVQYSDFTFFYSPGKRVLFWVHGRHREVEQRFLLPGLRWEPGRLLLRERGSQVLLHQKGPGHPGRGQRVRWQKWCKWPIHDFFLAYFCSLTVVIGIIVGTSAAILILTLVSCFCCSCCLLYKKRNCSSGNLNNDVIATPHVWVTRLKLRRAMKDMGMER